VRVTATTVEIFHRGVRVASHARSYRRGMHTTVADHMPAAHRAHHGWSRKEQAPLLFETAEPLPVS
jgi:transposase